MVKQGTILKLNELSFPVLVVSKDSYNASDCVVVCPVKREKSGTLSIEYDGSMTKGCIICDDLKKIDLSKHDYMEGETLSTLDIVRVSSMVESLFDFV